MDAPDGIEGRVMSAVERRIRARRMRAYLLYPLFMMALASAGFSVRLFISDVTSTQLGQLIGLALSDTGEVMGAFGDWLMALVESLPSMSLILVLATILIAARIFVKIRTILKSYPKFKKAV